MAGFELTLYGRFWVTPKVQGSSSGRICATRLPLVTAMLGLPHIERAVQAFSSDGQTIDPELLKYLSPLGWEQINLTGDYQWNGKRPAQGRFRTLRIPNRP